MLTLFSFLLNCSFLMFLCSFFLSFFSTINLFFLIIKPYTHCPHIVSLKSFFGFSFCLCQNRFFNSSISNSLPWLVDHWLGLPYHITIVAARWMTNSFNVCGY